MTQRIDTSVAGEDDNWMLFERKTADGYPLVVLARIDNPEAERVVRDGSLTTVVCEADRALVNDDGMPQHSDRLYILEEKLAAGLERSDGETFHVASVTGDGVRRIVFAHTAAIEFAPIVSALQAKGYTLRVAAVDRPADMIALVTPTAVERQLDGDMSVIANLEKSGDDVRSPRRADFWFYGERARLDALVAELAPWGYAVDRWLADPDGVVVHSETPVDLDTFRQVTPVLIQAAERHGVTYDGWETSVVKAGGEARAPSAPRSLLSKLFGSANN